MADKDSQEEEFKQGLKSRVDDIMADMDNFGEVEALDDALKEKGMDGGSKQLQDGISNLLYLVVNKGIPAKDVLQMPPEMVETLYGHAYNMYNQGKYDEAEHLFRFLMLLDPAEPKYAFGQAAVAHMKKDFEAAAKMYYLVSLMAVDDPMPHYHSSDCYMQMGDLGSALLSLEFAIDASGSNPKYTALVEKAKTLKKALEEKLNLKGDEMTRPTEEELNAQAKKKKKKKLKKAKAKKPVK